MVEEEMKDERPLVAGKGDNSPPPPLMDHRSKKCSLLLVAAHIFDKLAPLLKSAYVVEACLLKFLLQHNDTSNFLQPVPKILKVLDLMWSLMQDFELKPCLEHLMVSMLSSYRFSPVTPDFRNPRIYLTLLVAILRHHQTRRFLLKSVLLIGGHNLEVWLYHKFKTLTLRIFDKIKFPIFLHIKPPDDAGLADMVPTVWWERNRKEGDDSIANESTEERERKTKYEAACRTLQEKIEDIEAIQIEILKILLYHKDIVDGLTTRVVFIEKFRQFLKENTGMARIHEFNTCPLPVGLCFFHRMVKVLRYFWDDFRKEDPVRFVNSSEAFMPIQEFWSDTRDYFEFQRCGGSLSHLNKMLGAEVNKAQGIEIKDGQVIRVHKTEEESLEYPDTEMPSGNSLMELLDGVAVLYHIASHKQLGKMSTLRDNLTEYVLSLEDTEKKLKLCPNELSEVKMELERARVVFLEKITEQARQMAWVIAVIYSESKQEDVAWLLGVAMKTVEKASMYKQLFQYMPEFYIEIVINTYNALKNYFHPTSSMEQIPRIDELNEKYAMFLITNFANNRIVISDARDNIIQALACFTCYEKSLKVLETLPVENQRAMMLSLIAPYENRSWAQTNWILVRIWKGCGFGFRYSHLPHLVPSKVQLTEFGTASLQPPCPSKVFQNFMKEILHTESEVATRFLDTLLSQLNWSFSEFIGMMQEIQQVLSRTEPRLLETRQLKICSTCFEISVCLFRVLEMAVNIASDLFLDPAKPSSDLLLSRLIQLVCQVLNRITMKGGMFDSVVSLYITGMESVTYYPILSVIAGILIYLILKTDHASQTEATVALLSDHSFHLKTLEFMLGAKVQSEKPIDNIDSLKDRVFDFRHYKEVNEEEISALQQLISHIGQQQQTFVRKEQVVKDEDICTICYANPKSAMFQPCGHQSCRTCISQQMMSKKECFFCKAGIVAVLNLQE
ncbi:hypothetical protein CHS0354_038485 [Potamilus streckersoni]|uniref:RING-type E3 ubiquitin transferase n=1 Tax=Potamilus streckersoni TaxID=2493646 RepID=A0AAE0VPM4_9BIVA|nr:hypothetical protein CHS0354_038485 [Potamilus streckersoni]